MKTFPSFVLWHGRACFILPKNNFVFLWLCTSCSRYTSPNQIIWRCFPFFCLKKAKSSDSKDFRHETFIQNSLNQPIQQYSHLKRLRRPLLDDKENIKWGAGQGAMKSKLTCKPWESTHCSYASTALLFIFFSFFIWMDDWIAVDISEASSK